MGNLVRTILFFALTSPLWCGGAAPPVKHMIVIGVDGLSSEGIERAQTPTFHTLMQAGSYSMKARAVLPNVTFVDSMNDVAEGCDALVVATEWDEFKKLDLERARDALTHPIMFDGRNLFDAQEMEKLGWIYKSVGR